MSTAFWAYRRRTWDSRVDYPLVTLCIVRVEETLRVAVSGAFNGPVVGDVPEDGSPAECTRKVLESIPAKYRNDLCGSSEYRQALLSLLLAEALEEVER